MGILNIFICCGFVLLLLYFCSRGKMPRGIYERNPGKKNKALQAGNLPFKKSSKGSFKFNTKNNKPDTRSDNNQKNEWMTHLLDKGYGAVGGPPNKAVQAIISIIPNDEIHSLILALNRRLLPGEFSPILHLGFSTWFETFFILDQKKMILNDCRDVIEQLFAKTQDTLADRTDLDDMLAIECRAAVTQLEKVHKRTDKTFETEKGKQVECCLDVSDTQGFVGYIPKEDKDLILKEKEASLKEIDKNNLVRLTLGNCLRFPVISEMAVEWLDEEFQQGLWRSSNFFTLAPISTKAWRFMGDIKDDEMNDVINETNNMKKIMDEEEINFPCQTEIFDKRCRKGSGMILCVKAHMAYLNTDRGYSYLHKIWRSWSPYLKCGCPPDTCKDTITWFDHAIWYLFNHLELIYPKYSAAGRMAYFLHFIRQNLKKPILAHLAYLHMRETLIKITNKLIVCPDCNVMQTFGQTRLVEVCEMTLKDENFLKAKYNVKTNGEKNNSASMMSPKTGSESYLPPRVTRSNVSSLDSSPKVVDLTSTSDTIISCTPGDGSVTKGRPSFVQRNTDGVQGILSFEKADTRTMLPESNAKK